LWGANMQIGTAMVEYNSCLIWTNIGVPLIINHSDHLHTNFCTYKIHDGWEIKKGTLLRNSNNFFFLFMGSRCVLSQHVQWRSSQLHLKKDHPKYITSVSLLVSYIYFLLNNYFNFSAATSGVSYSIHERLCMTTMNNTFYIYIKPLTLTEKND
jgi:hypothetical protein